ncbi:phage tail protein [Erwinia persicina]|uniref:phage tail-collar fiber domain-containing protein n=1 Tax=Erwinia persicina TaxID=55211 RepID=UPI001FD1B24C|nr:phage tail protein [Erwinia persicina]
MAQKFQSIVTLTGQARIAAAVQGSNKADIITMVVGDGNGEPTVPDASQTHLVNEVWRVRLNSLKVDAKNKNWLIAEAIAPASVGGFWMRELGLLASDGSLMAVCNMAETYKPSLEQGSGRTQTLRMVLSVTDTSAVTLLIDDSISLATEEYVNDRLDEHEQSRNHPDATLSERGFALLSSTISEDETRAATPKAVKAANDNANGRVPASRKVNGMALTSDITLGAASVGAYTRAETDKQVAAAMTAADNANNNANGRVPSLRKVNGLSLASDVTLTATDVKALAVTTVRAQGNPSVGNVGNANDLPPNATSFVYNNVPNSPPFTGSLLDFSGLGNGYNTQIVAEYNGDGARAAFRTRNGDSKTWNTWNEFYHTGNKPTPGVIFPLSVLIDDAQNLNNYTVPGLYFQPANTQASSGANYPEAQAGSMEVYKHAGITQVYRIYNSSRQYIRTYYAGSWTAWTKVYDTANKPSPGEIGALPAGGTAVAATKLATARSIAGVAFDGQSNIAIPASNVGAYTKAEVDSRVNAKAPMNTASKAVNGWWKCGSTGLIIQWGQIPAGNGERVVPVTFPVAFPNAVRSVSGIISNASENVDLDAFLEYTDLNNRASVRFMLGNTTGGWSMGGCWMAIGY